ncbi:FAM166B [Cordylochernes scorpioides]|uniref:FAM166B n=1 Tax=Cordylochernes scorpioides TaxID=51811 RepID=A0ABY6KTG1_9ARAC|nr:FAM166B [Cordylochernes scorpioides]
MTIAKPRVRGPLKRIALEAEWPASQDYSPYTESPYNISNRDPRKYFVPGYTGYVPGLRFATGVTYGLATNHGLCRFTQALDERRASGSRPVVHDWHRPDAKEQTDRPHLVLPNHVLPFMDTGCLPKYTGYVPGIDIYLSTYYNALERHLL